MGCMCTTIMICIFFFLSIFAFQEMDQKAWVGTIGDHGQKSLFASELEGEQARAVEFSNIHAKFTNWSKVGFYLILTFLLYTIVALPSFLAD